MYRFTAVPGLDERRVESGSDRDRDRGNERERGERAVMEADKVRNWARGRGLGRRCRRGFTGTTSVSSTIQTPGKGKEEPFDVVGVAGALLVSDPTDAQDIIGLGRTWWAYPGSSSSQGSGTSRSGVESPGVDMGERRDSDGGNGEREC
jgi:hypothetical protein